MPKTILKTAIFRDTLKETPFNANLISFKNGEEMIKALSISNIKPSIIFLNLKMPGKDGKQCLREIRSNPLFNNIPVVIFTVTAYMHDIKETFNFGANLYVPKNIFIKNNTKALTMILETTLTQSSLSPSKEKFVLGGDTTFFTWI